MNAAELLRDLRHLNIKVGIVGDQLDVDGPSDVLNDTVLEMIGQHKAQLVNLLSANGHAASKQANGVSEGEETTLIQDVCLADVEAKPIEWLWENRIPRHSITIFEGIEGEGKSTLLCAIAAAVTCGKGLSDMRLDGPSNVVWLSAEDDLPRVLKPRLLAAGADVSRVFAVGDPFSFDQKGILALIDIVARREPSLVVIDPIFAYTKGDASKGNDARATTNDLKILAEKFACALVLVRHVGKAKGLGDPRAAGLYSIEWRAAARSVLLVGSDPDNKQKRAITQTKNNFGPKAPSIGYVIEPDTDSPSGARFNWMGTSDLTAERILASITHDDEKIGRREAEDFLRDILADGEREADPVTKQADRLGISRDRLRRARESLCIKPTKRGFGKDQKWYWSIALPEMAERSPEMAANEKPAISAQIIPIRPLTATNYPEMASSNGSATSVPSQDDFEVI